MRLYKYLHPDRIDVLKSGLIRFTPAGGFNDPFDMKPNIHGVHSRKGWDTEFPSALDKVIAEQYEALPPEQRKLMTLDQLKNRIKANRQSLQDDGYKSLLEITPSIRKTVESAFDAHIGVLSLTEKPDNLPMWAHYADEHRGFVMEFDATHPFFDQRVAPSDELRNLQKVQYDTRRPALILADINSIKPFLIKGCDWEYEQEWRILMPLSSANEVRKGTPFDIHLFAFPNDAVKSIILGCRSADILKTGIVSTIEVNPEYKNTRLLHARVDDAEYKLNLEELI